MKTIHKHHLFDVINDVTTHEGARPLYVAEQHDAVTVWTEVDDTRPVAHHRFHVVGTGGQVPEQAAYVGTAVLQRGSFVFHVYDGGDR